MGQAYGLAIAADHGNIRRAQGIALGVGDAPARCGHRTAGVRPADPGAAQIRNQTGAVAIGKRHPGDVSDPARVVGDGDAAVIDPLGRIEAHIQRIGKHSRLATGKVEHVQPGVGITHALVVETQVSEALAIWRPFRRLIRTHARSQPAHRAVGQRDPVDLGFEGIEIDIGVLVRRNEQTGAIRRPRRHTEDVELPASELARRAAVGGHDENVGESRIDVTGTIRAKIGVLDHDHRRRPFGPFRWLGHARQRLVLAGYQGGVGQLAAIRRPGQVGRPVFQLGDARGSPAVQPAHKDLRLALVAGHVGDPRGVGRPRHLAIGHATGGQRLRGTGGAVEQPQVGAAHVLHAVEELPLVDQFAPVRRQHRVVGPLQGEDVHRCKGRR